MNNLSGAGAAKKRREEDLRRGVSRSRKYGMVHLI